MTLRALEVATDEIVMSGDFTRRVPVPRRKQSAKLAALINQLLEQIERSEAKAVEKMIELGDVRDDAQTSNLLLRKAKNDLKSRGDALDVALKKAAIANQAKSQFLANMSHEIRTPLNGILGMAELLHRSDMQEKQQRQIKTIVQSGRALLTIINDILDFSKVESGKFEIDPRPFDLKSCVSDIAELLTPVSRQKGLDLKLEIASDLPRWFVGDAGRIRQIVTNLAGNGVKFTDRGSVTLRLSGCCVDGNADLKIEIIDTGIGIPEDKIADVFETFSQVDQTCTRRHEGTGLGLSICKLLANRMGGAISATSTIGSGSTFCFQVKLPLSEAVAPLVIHVPDKVARTKVVVPGNADDIQPVVSALANSESDFDIVLVPDLSHDATQHALAGQTNTVVVLSAWDVTESLVRNIAQLKQRLDGNLPPVIAVIQEGNKGDTKILADAGVRAYLSGPVHGASLKKAIAAVQIAEPGRLLTKHDLGAVVETAADVEAVQSKTEKAKPRILIVDDSMVNREVAKDFLEDIECDIFEACNGQEAVDKTAAELFDLILMDCQMPVMDGFAATQAIRARAVGVTGSSVPIIALTANAFASDREKCLGAGMSDFLSKPFRPDEFDQTIQKWLSAQPQ